MQIVNLTPHAINLPDRVIESSGIARCPENSTKVGEVDGIPIYRTEYGPAEVAAHEHYGQGVATMSGLPMPEPGKIFVVSMLVAQQHLDRADVYYPAKLIRDEQGRVIGCGALGQINSSVAQAAKRFAELLSGSMADIHGQVVYPTADDWRLVEDLGAPAPASGRTVWPPSGEARPDAP